MKNKVAKFNLLPEVQDQLTKGDLILVKGGASNRVAYCGCIINNVPSCGCRPD